MKMQLTYALSALTLIATLSLSSCKKQYSCSCETKLTAPGYSSTSSTKESYSLKFKEKQAKAACDNTSEILEKQMKDQNAGSGLSVSVDCELK